MAKLELPPASLSSIAGLIKVSNEFIQRDIIVTYWARLQALQAGLKLPRTPDAQPYLFKIMDWLEQAKSEHKENQAITNDVVAQSHLEHCALQIFQWADREDRASKFNMATIKAFYTASYLFDVLGAFGDLSEELVRLRKYSKWKAAYLYRAQKEGFTPVPGPAAMEGEDDAEIAGFVAGGPTDSLVDRPPVEQPQQPPVPAPRTSSNADVPPEQPPQPAPVISPEVTPGSTSSLTSADFLQAQKFCKYANSALQYEDAATAIENLRKALELLQTKR